MLALLLTVAAVMDGAVHEEPLFVPDSFKLTDPDATIASFPAKFEFGIATAPAHVEDGLEDSWVAFARAGRVPAWENVPRPEERTRFWSDPSPDIELAAGLGVSVFRMGVDWGRMVGPTGPPAEGSEEAASRVGGVLLPEVWARYRAIMLEVHTKKMKIMLTLFHHSMAPYLMERGGWTNATTVGEWSRWTGALFGALSEDEELSGALHSVVTMNEPHVFVLFTHCAAMWPPDREVNIHLYRN